MAAKLTREEMAWSLYDVGNSAYILLVTAVIPLYVKSLGEAAGYTAAQTTAHWGFVQSAGTFLMALSAPVLGAMADYQGQKKKFFRLFFLVGVLSLLAMSFVEGYGMLLALNGLCALGYAGANNFYDAFLVDVTSPDRMDRISSVGYALGYVGSCIPFVISIGIIFLHPFGLSTAQGIRLALLLTALWWFLFTLPMEKRVQQRYGLKDRPRRLVRRSFRRVWNTFRRILRDRRIGLFLLAYFFYIDGVDTIIKMSTSFGYDVGIDDTQLVLALLVTQLVAFPAVLLFARLVGRFSAKKIILFSIGVYFGICVFGYFLRTAWQFWVLAIVVGMVQGTVQALSRSYFGRLVPRERNNEYFGFYNILGKYATILGPLLMAVITGLTGNSRYGVLSVALLFAAGFLVFRQVPDVGAAGEE